MRLEYLEKPVRISASLHFRSGEKRTVQDFDARYVVICANGAKAYFPTRPAAIAAINQAVNEERMDLPAAA